MGRRKTSSKPWLVVVCAALAGMFAARLQAAEVDVLALSPAQQTALLNTLNQQAQCCAAAVRPEPPRTWSTPASVRLETLFSAQAGSWPFEPFAQAGLFSVLAGYQPRHPEILVIRGGEIDLPTLMREVNDPAVLSQTADGYLLSYPLLIGEDAGLRVQGVKLYLNTDAGAHLINLGQLRIRQATLTHRDTRGAAGHDAFRPFVISWAGSRTYLHKARVRGLGFKGHLTHGLTLARHAQQAAGVAAPLLVVEDSEIVNLVSGIDARGARLHVRGARIEGAHLYGIDLNQSQFLVQDSQILGVRQQDGIRIQGNSQGLLTGNRLEQIQRSGITLSGQRGRVDIVDNRMDGIARSAIQLRDVQNDAQSVIRVTGNTLTGIHGSAIDIESTRQALILDNAVTGSLEYAVSLRGMPQGHVVVLGNTLHYSHKAAIRSEDVGRLVLGANQFAVAPPSNRLLAGDLQPVQSQVLDAVLKSDCYVEIRAAASRASAGEDGGAQALQGCSAE